MARRKLKRNREARESQVACRAFQDLNSVWLAASIAPRSPEGRYAVSRAGDGRRPTAHWGVSERGASRRQHGISARFLLMKSSPIAATPNSASVPGSGASTADLYSQMPVWSSARFVGYEVSNAA